LEQGYKVCAAPNKPFREQDIFEAMHKHIGVRYIYQESIASPSLASSQADVFTPDGLEKLADDMATLPRDLVASLRQATIECDADLIVSFIAQIRCQNELLANNLSDLAENFRFEQILDLTQSIVSK
jgi:hypothetical protein